MIDLQAHVLPGLDDGAADEAAAIEMCKAAMAAGTREMVATPSCDPKFGLDRAEIENKTRQLQEKIGDGLHLHTGAVLELTYESFAAVLPDLSRYSINRGRYILVRPSKSAVTRGAAKLLSVIRDVGYTPILSQPETSEVIRNDLRRLRHWIKRGSLIAVGAGSLFGRNGSQAEECALALLDMQMAHFIVSDARSAGKRSPALDDAYDFASYRWGPERARTLLIDNPWSALWGEPIVVPQPRLPREGFSISKALVTGRLR